MGFKKIDVIGKRFGRLVVISEAPTRASYNRYFICQCDCGNQKEIFYGSLYKGATQSCGCIWRETVLPMSTRKTHGMTRSREYRSWEAMKSRCSNPKASHYRHYGGRGISVCELWQNSFENFYADMGPRPKGKTLERKDVNENYTPKNCEWADYVTQRRNQRPHLRSVKVSTP